MKFRHLAVAAVSLICIAPAQASGDEIEAAAIKCPDGGRIEPGVAVADGLLAACSDAAVPRARKADRADLDAVLAQGDDATSETLVVDADRVQCPDADFTTIQAAVVAAAPGDRVEVCPDSYNEQVTVPKTLSLIGRSEGGSREDEGRNCFRRQPLDPTRDVILEGARPTPRAFAFRLQANDIVVDGFTMREHFGTAVSTNALFSGYLIRDNLFRDYTNAGIGGPFSTSGTTETVVRENCFQGRGRFPAFSRGIRSDGALHNVLIRDNAFFQNGATGMAIDAFFAPSSDVRIIQNRSRQDGVFLDIARTTNSEVSGNDVEAADFRAIDVVEGNNGLRVTHNSVTGGRDGINVSRDRGPRPNVGLLLSDNLASDLTLSGIRVRANGATGSELSQNRSKRNGQDGLRVESGGNSGNRIELNVLRGNGEHDCHDDTVGPGTGGTANLWVKNNGVTENRPGLCANAVP